MSKQNRLDTERVLLDDSDAFDAPWMATVTVGEEVHFEIDRSRTWAEPFEPPEEWRGKGKTMYRVRAEMRNIVFADSGESVDIDGEHLVPFWAGAALKKALKQSTEKRWVALAFYRQTEEEQREDRTVTINSANFALFE